MKYYRIKILSPVNSEIKHYEVKEPEKKVLMDIGLEGDSVISNEFYSVIAGVKAKRNTFVHYKSNSSFELTEEPLATIFSEEDTNEPMLLEYLCDKEYELIEADGSDRIMRYRRE